MTMDLYNLRSLFGTLFIISEKPKFSKAESIFVKDDLADSFYIVMDGIIDVYTDSPNPKSKKDENLFKIATLKQGDVLGEMALFLNEPKRTVSAVSKSASTLLKITYDDFKLYSQKDQQPLMYLSKLMAERLQRTTMRAENIVINNVFDRVKYLLIELSQDEVVGNGDTSITLKISKKEISQMIGCSREMAGKAITKLKDDGFLTSQGQFITINICNLTK